VTYAWEAGKAYTIRVKVVGNRFEVAVNGQALLKYTDDQEPYLKGQIGFSNFPYQYEKSNKGGGTYG
jgi:ribosome maturation protein Sdo1